MFSSLAIIILAGLFAAAVCDRLRLPRIVGMIFTGIICGPYALDLLDPSILSISSELRQIALIIILVKAGITLDVSDLKKVGRPALLLSFVPASFELLAYTVLAPVFLPVSHTEAALMGSVLAAVSPAVVVPRMVHYIEKGYGTEKSIPQMILAGASCDDIFVIVLFSSFLSMAQGGNVRVMDFVSIPLSIISGILVGAVTGILLSIFFESAFNRKRYIRNSMKVLIIMGMAFLLMAVEQKLKGRIPMSGLLAVVSMAAVLKIRSVRRVSKRLGEKFGKLWIAAEIMLFVLVGAAVDIRYTLAAGVYAAILIFLALAIRSVGVWISIAGTGLNFREKLFCVIAYLPKATVQAAIGSVPLAAGLPCGSIILSVAVLGILLTAPLGAFGMDRTYKRILQREGQTDILFTEEQIAQRESESI
ncbi:MAG: cation:proton antiporter [Eubacterium sp.]|nr:cation:proton antiporter [Eubacterium sp.]